MSTQSNIEAGSDSTSLDPTKNYTCCGNRVPKNQTGGRIRRLPSCRVVKPHQWTRLFAVGGDS